MKKHYFLAISLTTIAAYGDIPTGLIGGTTSGSEGYSAFIASDGTVSPISGLSTTSQINSVSLNSFGTGLIGGLDPAGGYAAFVSPSGALDVLNLNLPLGTIASASINHSGNGIVGGNDGSFNMYAALVSSDGTITPLSTPLPGFILSTALNDEGIALIGGEGNTFPYAAYVTSGGAVNQIDTTPLIGGHLVVAINTLGNGIIGGFSTIGAYAAFVTPNGITTSPLSPLPSGFAFISSVAINNLGFGLIGGNDSSGNMYAGYSDASGTVTPLFNTPDPGQIVSVAINDSGTGLIGGYDNSNLYAALVQSDGSLTPLFVGPAAGSINTVALNNAGVGLIGGQSGFDGYAALVAPNGTLTVLDMTGQSNIASVALYNDQATPSSAGPYFSAFYTQLAACSALEPRFARQTRRKSSETSIAQTEVASNEEALLAQNSDVAFWARERKKTEKKDTPEKNNTVWLAPFGNYVRLKAQNTIPNYTNEIGGALLGYDHHESNYLVGTSAGYAFDYIHYSEGLGHSKLQEEMLSLYGAYYLDHFWFDAALWGGVYQLSNVRHTLSRITSTSSTHGWILSPHVEMASPWALDNNSLYFIEPFLLFDWVNFWQAKYTEKGASGLNLKMPSLYGSFLQSEAGLRFYERFEYTWGDFCLEEKLSYINQAPFHLNTVSASFVGAASTFPIAVGSTNMENLGSFALISSFIPANPSYPFGGFAIQVTANKNYQSYFGSVFLGLDF